MNESHSDCTHNHSPDVINTRVFKIGITLNLIFVVIEIIYGISSHSLALISDAFHNLADVFGLVLAWLGVVLATKTKGKKFSIYAALINSGLLLLGSLWVIKEAYERYHENAAPAALTMIVVAFIGFIINLTSAKLFHKDHHHDLNVRSAYLHLMADAAISLGVVITGIIIYYTSLYKIDPVISFIISLVVICGTWPLFREAINLLQGKTPKHLDIIKIKKTIEHQTALTVTEIKVQALSTAEFSVEAKLTKSLSEPETQKLEKILKHDYKITKVTLL
jgi:cobalt-zinc-cadmium efflux system protein